MQCFRVPHKRTACTNAATTERRPGTCPQPEVYRAFAKSPLVVLTAWINHGNNVGEPL